MVFSQKVFSEKARRSSKRRPERLLSDDRKFFSEKTTSSSHRKKGGRLIEFQKVFSEKTTSFFIECKQVCSQKVFKRWPEGLLREALVLIIESKGVFL